MKLRVGDKVKILKSDVWLSRMKRGQVRTVIGVGAGFADTSFSRGSTWCVPRDASMFAGYACLLPRTKRRAKARR